MSAGIELAILVIAVIAAVALVLLPFFRPPAGRLNHVALAMRDEDRARLFTALEELARDRRAGMISQVDYTAAVNEIRRRLATL